MGALWVVLLVVLGSVAMQFLLEGVFAFMVGGFLGSMRRKKAE